MADSEPTVFPNPSPPLRDIRSDELAAFAEDGVFCARDLIEERTIDRMREATEEVIRDTHVLGNGALDLAEKGFHGDIFVWKLNDAFRDLALFSSLPSLASQLLGSESVNFFYEQFFIKRAGSPVDTPWHQDIPFWPVSGTQIVSFWITLDSVTRESSGLEFVRGSHRWEHRYQAITPNYDPYMMDTDLPPSPDFAKQREETELLGWDMEPGDALVFDSVVCHGSGGNSSPTQDRRALAFRYAGDDVVYAPRHATMPLLWEHGLQPGQRLGGSLFPQVWPHVIESEISRRWEGPEPPSPKALEEFFEHLKASGFGPGGNKRSLFE
ncbi:MAG TPA: phytanoyl-CoA dioxygenase family protein [Myxococcales bacterium]|jgi:ectoine hydroxylase-related dioxygenase (phytanoyl-CoA dioxygenase family)|nr:phytanoyl-CoA dioxygenase family protein [Myxococcales bacterium]HIL79941.1 phytanoyl-CoA dioxygenase family protein [Myxococcales bacterium]